jgi:hypothetical protein
VTVMYSTGSSVASGDLTIVLTSGGDQIDFDNVRLTGPAVSYYLEDLLGTSRVMTTSNGVVCYDADFYPYGGERTYTSTCPTNNNYKFEGKERDAETGNDDCRWAARPISDTLRLTVGGEPSPQGWTWSFLAQRSELDIGGARQRAG